MKVLLTIGAIIGMSILAALLIFVVFYSLGKKESDNREDAFHDAFDGVFWLQGYLKSREPEVYKKAAKELDNALNALLEVERIAQEEEQ